MRFLAVLQFKKSKNIIAKKENLKTTGMYKRVLLELFMFLPHPSPFLDGVTFQMRSDYLKKYYTQTVNEIMTLFMLMRIIVIIRAMLMRSVYYSTSSQRVCMMYGTEPSYLFVIKSLFKDRPIMIITVSMAMSLPFFAFALRICERPLSRVTQEGDFSYDSYYSAIWNVIVTMTTVGYGDLYARTNFGRIVAFMTCIWGVFIVSMMVITLGNTLNMDNLEYKAFSVISRLHYRKILKYQAADLVTGHAKNFLASRKVDKRGRPLKQPIPEAHINELMTKFRMTSRRYKALCETANLSEELARQFDFLREEFRGLDSRMNLFMDINVAILQHLQAGDEGLKKRISEHMEKVAASGAEQTTTGRKETSNIWKSSSSIDSKQLYEGNEQKNVPAYFLYKKNI
eukprot:TRINITY_DN4528_c0_g3_i5.p1 TRINITY_DN4528_c0_g3~~TRINITY_DN4528_c0_g3_i5.p1  ORF type:complete len:399 (-),score=52.63 TRINITY_DN4528_c0_g3_i5:419-1615(-)